MFRRKGEESLFDTPNDLLEENDAAEANAPAQNAPSNAPSSQSSFANTTSGAAPTPPSGQPNSPLARPASKEQARSETRPDTRSAASAPTSNFRPATSPLGGSGLGGELNRNRISENKSNTTSNTTMGMNVDKSSNAKLGNRRVLTVGNDILLKGEIATCDRLVIEGKVDATLNDVHTVEISETGSFKGSADIEDAEISGLFEGDLVVRNRLVIYASGKVRGKITYGEIEIERGGELTGEIKTTVEDTSSASTRTRSKKEDVVAA